jgi:hypothetical protein
MSNILHRLEGFSRQQASVMRARVSLFASKIVNDALAKPYQQESQTRAQL